MATIKKPKLKSLPKKPKAKDSLERHLAFEKKAKEVIVDNSKKVNEYNAKVTEKTKAANRKKSIVSGIGALYSKSKSKLKNK
jgi:hypothetical protein